MANINNYKDWPTIESSAKIWVAAALDSLRCLKLNDSGNCSASISVKKESKPDVLNSSSGMGNSGSSVNCTSSKPSAKERDRKRGGKTKWLPAPRDNNPIKILSYRDAKNEQRSNELNKFAHNTRKNNWKETTKNSENVQRSSNRRGFRGGRHSQFRSRHESSQAADYENYQRVPQEAGYVMLPEESMLCAFRGGRHSQFRSRHESSQAVDIEKYLRVPQEAGYIMVPEESAEEIERKELIEKIKYQIQFYFGDFNLAKDGYLRLHMDHCGYVALSLIAIFPRIQQLTDDYNIILEAVQKSVFLEVTVDNEGEAKIRTAMNPLKWVMDEETRKLVLKCFVVAPGGECYIILNPITAQFNNLYIDSSDYQPDPSINLSRDIYRYILDDDHVIFDKSAVPMDQYYAQANSDQNIQPSCDLPSDL